MTSPGPREASHVQWPARAAAITLLILGFIPFAAFLPVGIEMTKLGTQVRDWATGTVLTIGVGIIAWMASRRGHWPTRAAPSDRGTPALSLNTRILLVALGALILYILVATLIFDRSPLIIDEMAQLWQAQRYAEGRLWVPAPAHREFFSYMHLVDLSDRVYAQFPPGGPFMLWLGVLVGAPWLVGPVAGACIVWLFSRLARAAEPDASERWVFGATLLFALTPFGVFMFGTYMNHVTALLWILVAVSGLIRLVGGSGMVAALTLGFGLGAAATIRPLDAFAFALPAAVWLVARAGKDRQRWIENIVAGCGVAIPFAAMMYVNVQTTGHPLLFGYEVLWGTSHGLGFHAAPWGAPHTPLRGLAIAALYQWRLQTFLFETPFPSLVLPVAALWFRRTTLGALDKYLLCSSGLVILFYFLYWHDGFYLGPRFVLPLLPVMVLWTARLPRIAADRLASSLHARAAVHAVLVFAVVGAVIFNLPVRIASYGSTFSSLRMNYAALADKAGVRDALVFVRESWGAQLVARLWGRGVSRPKTEAIYRVVDVCHLELALTEMERTGVSGAAAERRFAALRAEDSLRVVQTWMSPDATQHMLPGFTYPPVCLERLEEDRAGFLHYVPLRLVTTGNNVYARDLHARDSLLLAEYPDRPVYLLRRGGTRVDASFEFVPLKRDSLYASWRRTP